MTTDPTFLPQSGTFGVRPAVIDSSNEPTPRVGRARKAPPATAATAAMRSRAGKPGVESLLKGMAPVREEPIPMPKGPETRQERAARLLTTAAKRRPLLDEAPRLRTRPRIHRSMVTVASSALVVGILLGLWIFRAPSLPNTRAEAAVTFTPTAPSDPARARHDEVPPPSDVVSATEEANAVTAEEEVASDPTAETPEARASRIPSSPSRARRPMAKPAPRSDFSRSQ